MVFLVQEEFLYVMCQGLPDRKKKRFCLFSTETRVREICSQFTFTDERASKTILQLFRLLIKVYDIIDKTFIQLLHIHLCA